MEEVFDLDAILGILIFFPILNYVLLFDGIFEGIVFHVVDDYRGDDASNAPALDRQDVVRVIWIGAGILLRQRLVQVSEVVLAKDISSYLE